MQLWVKIAISLVVGLALGFVLFFAGMIVGGVGHGWTTPFWFSFLGPVVCPVVVFRVLSFRDQWLGFDFALIVAAIILDFMIYTMTIEEGVHYFHRVGEFAYVWIGLWSLWQVALLIKLVIVMFRSNNKPQS